MFRFVANHQSWKKRVIPLSVISSNPPPFSSSSSDGVVLPDGIDRSSEALLRNSTAAQQLLSHLHSHTQKDSSRLSPLLGFVLNFLSIISFSSVIIPFRFLLAVGPKRWRGTEPGISCCPGSGSIRSSITVPPFSSSLRCILQFFSAKLRLCDINFVQIARIIHGPVEKLSY